MFFDHLPEPAGIRIGWHPFKHQGGCPVGQRAIQDIAMSGYPAHIGCTPVNITILIIKDIMMGHRGIDHIAAGGMQYPFGLTGRAGGIQDEHRIFGIHFFWRAVRRGSCQRVMIPDIAPFFPANRCACAANNKAGGAIRAALQGFVCIGL